MNSRRDKQRAALAEDTAKREKIENAFKPRSRYDLPKLMEETLQAIHPGLMWEYGPAVKQKDGYRLVITHGRPSIMNACRGPMAHPVKVGRAVLPANAGLTLPSRVEPPGELKEILRIQ